METNRVFARPVAEYEVENDVYSLGVFFMPFVEKIDSRFFLVSFIRPVRFDRRYWTSTFCLEIYLD